MFLLLFIMFLNVSSPSKHAKNLTVSYPTPIAGQWIAALRKMRILTCTRRATQLARACIIVILYCCGHAQVVVGRFDLGHVVHLGQ